MSDALILGADGTARCGWATQSPTMLAYHDTEWGFPVGGDVALFEKLCLDGFQAELSWRTILHKRDAFRAGFAGFDIDTVAHFTAADVDRLLGDAGIVRHRGKIEAVISNARRAQEMTDGRESLGALLWRHAPPAGHRSSPGATTSPEAAALSEELKREGWKFVGPTAVFAFMQAVGMVNDHLDGCRVQKSADDARERFTVPR